MDLYDFHYRLPKSLIAQYPSKLRTDARMLVMEEAQQCSNLTVNQFPSLLNSGDLLVFNNTKVLPARLFAQKSTGGKVEIFLERLLKNSRILVQIRANRSPKVGAVLLLDDGVVATVVGRDQGFYTLELNCTQESVSEYISRVGHMPLPPYIERSDEEMDAQRYQTVYASRLGSVAAPTAGLHFDQALLDELQGKGVNFAYVTLHVGAGTFQPVRVEKITDHKMHQESIEVSQKVCDLISETRLRGDRVIAVGTTSVRCLETAANLSDGEDIQAFQGDTDIFIYPGYHFKVIDGLLTNFHLPESTLLMLVSALAGRQRILDAYRYAIENQYRFFSYGDAMFIPNPDRRNYEI